MSMVVDALKNVIRTFLSLLVVGFLIYGGIYLINEYRNQENDVIVDNDEQEEDKDEDTVDESDKDLPTEFETITYKEPIELGGQSESGFSRTGTVSLTDRVEVGSDLSSNVDEVKVSEGQTVKKGDTLFTLQENTTTKQLAINLASAEKQLMNARRALELTQTNAAISENSYRIQLASAGLALDQAILSLDSSRDLAARQLGVEDMAKDVEELSGEISANSPSLEKTINQVIGQGISEFAGSDLENQYDLEGAQEELSEKSENLEYGQRQLQLAQNYYSRVGGLQQIESARLQIESTKSQIASQRVATDLNVNQLVGQINQAEAQVALAKVQMDQTTVKAPVDGVIVDVDLVAGQKVSPGMNYIVMTSDFAKKVNVFVSIEQASQLKKGQSVEVVYAGKKMKGEIEKIGLLADERSRLIEVEIGNIESSENLVANSFTKINFTKNTDVKNDVVATVVPFKVLKIENNKYLAPVLEDGKIVYKTVTVAGPIESGKIKLVAGLSDGDEIVVSNVNSLISSL